MVQIHYYARHCIFQNLYWPSAPCNFQEYCCVHSIKTLAHYTQKCNKCTQLQWFCKHFHHDFFRKIFAVLWVVCEGLYIPAVYTILERKEGRNLFNHSIPSSRWVFLILICCQVNQVWTLGEPSLFTWSSLNRSYMYPSRWCFIEENIVSRAAPGLQMGHANNGVIFWFIGSSQWCLYATVHTQSNSDWLSWIYCKLIGWYWKIMRMQLYT